MDGWEPLMCGWEPKSSQHLLVTQLRGYAVTHMLLYDQLYPHNTHNNKFETYTHNFTCAGNCRAKSVYILIIGMF